MTEACSDARKYGRASWTKKIGPLTLTSIDLVKPASEKLPMGSARAFAALLTMTSIPPNRSPVAATRARTSSSDPMWHAMPTASMPAAHSSSCVAARGVRLSTRDDHTSPGTAEPFGNGAANAAGTSGDEGDPPVETEEPIDVNTLALVHQRGAVSLLRHRRHDPGSPSVMGRSSSLVGSQGARAHLA